MTAEGWVFWRPQCPVDDGESLSPTTGALTRRRLGTDTGNFFESANEKRGLLTFPGIREKLLSGQDVRSTLESDLSEIVATIVRRHVEGLDRDFPLEGPGVHGGISDLRDRSRRYARCRV